MIWHILFLVINLLAVGLNARTLANRRVHGWGRVLSMFLIAACSFSAGLMLVAIYGEVKAAQ